VETSLCRKPRNGTLTLGVGFSKDQPSSDQNVADRTSLSPSEWSRLKPKPTEGVWSEADHAQFMVRAAWPEKRGATLVKTRDGASARESEKGEGGGPCGVSLNAHEVCVFGLFSSLSHPGGARGDGGRA
jgi:hypothetical protein